MADRPKTYSTIWRWHFYAGILITPIMLVMAVTGGIYLFQHEIDNALYGDVLYNNNIPSDYSPDHDAIVSTALASQGGGSLKTYQPPHNALENARVTVTLPDQPLMTVLVNPQTLAVVGTINEQWRLTNLSKEIHGGLMAGTFGEIVVELVACWTIIMIITGLYLWWPRVKGLGGALLPRLNQSNRIFWRDLHAVPGFILSLWMLVIISTGLPWSVVWGNLLDEFAISINEEFPQEIFSQRPQSVPLENPSSESRGVSINQLVNIAHQQGFHHGFEIQSPWGPTGSYGIMPGHHGSGSVLDDKRYLFVDQYSGEILLRIDWDDIGAVGKATSVGISLHEGRLFGSVNQFINLAAVVVLIWLGISGMIMWLKRRPKGALGAPKKQPALRFTKTLLVTIVALGIVMPLAGISMLLVWALDKTLLALRPAS